MSSPAKKGVPLPKAEPQPAKKRLTKADSRTATQDPDCNCNPRGIKRKRGPTAAAAASSGVQTRAAAAAATTVAAAASYIPNSSSVPTRQTRSTTNAAASSSTSAILSGYVTPEDYEPGKLSSGSDDDKHRVCTLVQATSATQQVVFLHTPVTAIKKIRNWIREMRQIDGRATPADAMDPIVVAMGNSYFLVQSTWFRKDCVIVPLRPGPRAGTWLRGIGKSYADIARALDNEVTSATKTVNVGGVKAMNARLQAVRNDFNTNTSKQGETNQTTLTLLRELALILLLDQGRASQAGEIMNNEAFADTTFSERFGGATPAYRGAPVGGSQKLQKETDARLSRPSMAERKKAKLAANKSAAAEATDDADDEDEDEDEDTND